ncbi:hypothetical protein I3843_03G239000 [Carya illinoinensis]|nr:hypothetical protein I3843_03G239000 [Carya illinoinensis]
MTVCNSFWFSLFLVPCWMFSLLLAASSGEVSNLLSRAFLFQVVFLLSSCSTCT